MAGQAVAERQQSPFGNATAGSKTGGLISVEQQRAIAQVQGSMVVARSMPRDRQVCLDLILMDCTDPDLAEEAEYEYSRGGSKITGPSIRLLETVARRWGNMECGVKELSRHDGFSEIEAFAWDMETGFKDSKIFQVRHWRDTKTGGHAITDERDIYELGANMAARRKRACMEAVIPRDIISKAQEQCEKTLATKIVIDVEFLKSLLESFEPFGVTKEMIEKRIQRHISAMTPGIAMQLKRIHTSLKTEMGQVSDFFDVTPAGGEQTDKPKTGVDGAKAATAGRSSAPTGDKVLADIKTKCQEAVAANSEFSHDVIKDAEGLAATLTGAQRQEADTAIAQAKGALQPKKSAPPDVGTIKTLCAQAGDSQDLKTAREKIAEAKELARSFKGADKSNADLAISQAEEAIDARDPAKAKK